MQLTTKIILDRKENLGQTLMNHDAWGIVSSHVEGADAYDNECRNRFLNNSFCDRDKFSLIGCWDGVLEHSYLILDPHFEIRGFRDEIRRKLSQQAIVSQAGLLTSEGETPISGLEVVHSAADGPIKLHDVQSKNWTMFGGDFFIFKF